MSSSYPNQPELASPYMRVLWQEARDRIHARLQAEGFDDIRAEHMAVLQHPGPDGERPSTLAARAGLSRQAMNRLLGHLESAEYLSREAPPGRPGARVVRLTPRGHEVMREIVSAVSALEAEWAGDVGEAHYADLKRAVVTLAKSRARR